MSVIPVTPLGMKKLQEELHDLKSVQRPRIIADISEARAHGDLKENAEYHAAREQQAFVEGRIRDIESKVSQAQVIDVKTIPNQGKIIFGTTVTLQAIENQDKPVCYTIVGEDEADVKENKISVVSPIARALIGKELNEEVYVTTPAGETVYEVIKIEHV